MNSETKIVFIFSIFVSLFAIPLELLTMDIGVNKEFALIPALMFALFPTGSIAVLFEEDL